MNILVHRLSHIPGVGKIILSVSDSDWERPLIGQAENLGLPFEVFSREKIRAKPRHLRTDRWQLPSDKGFDSWVGTPLAEIVQKYSWDFLILVPLTNLLVDRNGLADSIALHIREGFDVTFSEDRVPGANWAIFENELLTGLQKAHPEIMETRGGLPWAILKPLYPFKTGQFHNPRDHAFLPADLRLNRERIFRVLENTKDPDFREVGFKYGTWIKRRDWQEVITDYGPDHAWIEPTSRCSGGCFACPNPSLKREKNDLEISLFEKGSKDLKAHVDLRWIFSGWGEPLLNPFLFEMLKMVDDGHSTLITSLLTDIHDVSVFNRLSMIRLSVDALEAISFNKLRPGCDWEKIRKFIADFSLGKKKNPDRHPELGVSLLKHSGNQKVSPEFLNYWKKICTPPFRSHFFHWPIDEEVSEIQWFQIIGVSDCLGQLPFFGNVVYTPLKRRACLHALTGFHLLQDGKITICPFDFEGNWPFGNIRENSPMDIWLSPHAKQFRRRHLEMDFENMFPCTDCKDWYHR